MPPRRPWRRLVVVGVVLLVALPVAVAGEAFMALAAEGSGPVPAAVAVSGDDGLWLGHAWVDGRHGQADLDALAARLKHTGIRDVFVHIGPLSDDGALNPALRPRARWLLTGLHSRLPGVRVQAWLGDLTGPGHLNLADPAVRARIVTAAAQVLAEGFDGIHYDLEPVPSGTPGYLSLLNATHALTRARHAILSVACDQIEPLPALHTVQHWLTGTPHWWTSQYLHDIASRADEIALMTYDTGMPTTAAYTGYLRIETRLALSSLPPHVATHASPAANQSALRGWISA